MYVKYIKYKINQNLRDLVLGIWVLELSKILTLKPALKIVRIF